LQSYYSQIRIFLYSLIYGMYSLAELRPGMAIIVDGEPHLVLRAQHSKQARGTGVAKTTVRNLITGAVFPKTFQGSEKIEPADIGYTKAQFLYSDGAEYHFMDSTDFSQFTFTEDDLGDQKYFLVDGMDVDIQNFDNKPISVRIPPKVVLTIANTDPGVKGDTASGGTKPATTETGLVVNVPFFIEIGEKIRINTESHEYVERA